MVNGLFTLSLFTRYPGVMLMLLALSMAAAPASASPAQRFDTAAMASFTASVTIRRGAGVGHDKPPPPTAHEARMTTVEDTAGQPHPALVYDFE